MSNHNNVDLFTQAYLPSQAGRLRLPAPALSSVIAEAQYVLRDDPTFPLPTAEQWERLNPQMQRLVFEMVRDATQYWLFEEDGDEARRIHDLLAERFAS